MKARPTLITSEELILAVKHNPIIDVEIVIEKNQLISVATTRVNGCYALYSGPRAVRFSRALGISSKLA